MDISKFKNLSNLMQYSGYCLTPKERLLIENSLLILQNNQKFLKIFYWGKILAITDDYYIAFGYKQDCLRHRRFFYSQDMIEWNFLPCVNESTYETTFMCDSMIQGDPGLVIDVSMPPIFHVDECNPDRIVQTDGCIKKLKEEQRLACIVHMISDKAMIVPRGALYNPINEIITFNPAFQGLSREDAIHLKNYQLFREPVNDYNDNLLKHASYNYSTDFLDTLDSLVPANKSFALTWERDEEIVVLRSLHYMGAIFLHEINTENFMFCYVGDGKMNYDLLFMT